MALAPQGRLPPARLVAALSCSGLAERYGSAALVAQAAQQAADALVAWWKGEGAAICLSGFGSWQGLLYIVVTVSVWAFITQSFQLWAMLAYCVECLDMLLSLVGGVCK